MITYPQILDALMAYAYYYPLFMSWLWMLGGIYYRFHWERSGGLDYTNPPEPAGTPPVSILVPCHNEESHIEETIEHLLQQSYTNYEIIAINDGSTDDTGAILDRLSQSSTSLRVIHLSENRGKAMALRAGAMLSNSEYLVCIDADALLDEHAIHWMLPHLIESPRVGAVTGNPRIRNRSTLLGKIQVGEFSSIVGLIKRAQRIYGKVFTVSGVVTVFRKAALQRINYWYADTVTDDIDVSWRLQIDHWDIRYEPNALCWILMPETYSGLWTQRLRWAMGGIETAMRYAGSVLSWRQRRMWGVLLEFFTSAIWSCILALITVLWILGKFIVLPEQLDVPSLIPGWSGVVLGMTCLLQFLVSMIIDSRYEKGLSKNFFWIVWYPLAYWLINTTTLVVALPRVLFRREKRSGKWTSPDRGVLEPKKGARP
jgi:biofilm PGA synthesis N-glycosyltransferase PgaC